ncbi:MAG TPA: hypothetical protein VFQ14_06840 [Thermoleophilaceae bacterium]|nr:hypothetical protein [Thermoleophilaceae bacterium]
MRTAKIHIPVEHLEAVRESLVGLSAERGRTEEIEDLLGQIDGAADEPRPCELTGSRAVLWGIVYDSFCVAAERLADDGNEYWRGRVAPEAARARVAAVGVWLELLLALGDPPGVPG